MQTAFVSAGNCSECPPHFSTYIYHIASLGICIDELCCVANREILRETGTEACNNTRPRARNPTVAPNW